MFHMRCSPVLAFKGQLCNVVHLVFHSLIMLTFIPFLLLILKLLEDLSIGFLFYI